MAKIAEDDLKSEANKTAWRNFAEEHKHIEDYSLGALLRLDSSLDYSEENSIISVKVQFLAVEIARNREGHNDAIRGKFKPTARKARGVKSESAAPNNAVAEIEHELKQVLGGQHPLLQ